MHATRVFFTICIAAWIMMCSGCGDFGWTEYYHVNRSNREVHFSIAGVTPDVSPTRLVAGDGTDELLEVTAEVGEVVHVEDTITITWTVKGDSEEKKVELKRDDLGIPSRVRGGRITFTFTADEKWDVTYSR